jgi:hypothetical protein
MHVMPATLDDFGFASGSRSIPFSVLHAPGAFVASGVRLSVQARRITADGEVNSEATLEILHNLMMEPHAFSAPVLTVLPRNA